MLLFANQLYRSLQKEVVGFQSDTWLTLKEIEHYFQVSFSHWAVLYKKFAFHYFRTKGEEIHFFKFIKPLFTSEIEYAHLLYQTELFQPSANEEGHCRFWLKESERLDRFIKEQTVFYHYYQHKNTSEDRYYFTRIKTSGPVSFFKVYEDKHLTSRYDPLVARLLSLERYHQYVQRYRNSLLH